MIAQQQQHSENPFLKTSTDIRQNYNTVGNNMNDTEENYENDNSNLQKTATFFFPKNEENKTQNQQQDKIKNKNFINHPIQRQYKINRKQSDQKILQQQVQNTVSPVGQIKNSEGQSTKNSTNLFQLQSNSEKKKNQNQFYEEQNEQLKQQIQKKSNINNSQQKVSNIRNKFYKREGSANSNMRENSNESIQKTKSSLENQKIAQKQSQQQFRPSVPKNNKLQNNNINLNNNNEEEEEIKNSNDDLKFNATFKFVNEQKNSNNQQKPFLSRHQHTQSQKAMNLRVPTKKISLGGSNQKYQQNSKSNNIYYNQEGQQGSATSSQDSGLFLSAKNQEQQLYENQLAQQQYQLIQQQQQLQQQRVFSPKIQVKGSAQNQKVVQIDVNDLQDMPPQNKYPSTTVNTGRMMNYKIKDQENNNSKLPSINTNSTKNQDPYALSLGASKKQNSQRNFKSNDFHSSGGQHQFFNSRNFSLSNINGPNKYLNMQNGNQQMYDNMTDTMKLRNRNDSESLHNIYYNNKQSQQQQYNYNNYNQNNNNYQQQQPKLTPQQIQQQQLIMQQSILMRKSKTADTTYGVSRIQQQQQYYNQANNKLMPLQTVQEGVNPNVNQRGKNFLQRKPQVKMLNRIFSSKETSKSKNKLVQQQQIQQLNQNLNSKLQIQQQYQNGGDLQDNSNDNEFFLSNEDQDNQQQHTGEFKQNFE